MSDQPLGVSVDTAVVPAPGYYPDPSVPGYVRYWNGGTWVPGTSRPAPPDGEVLAAPAFASRPAVRPGARYIPPPAMPQAVRAAEPEPSAETGPVFLDQTSAGAVFTMAPAMAQESAGPAGAVAGTGWQANPQEQRGLLETGGAPRWVSWGVVGEAAVAELAAAGPGGGAEAVAEAESVPEPEPDRVPAAVRMRKSGPSTSGGGVPRTAPVGSARAGSAPVRVPRASRPAPALVTAGLGRRLAARLVDLAVVGGVAAAVGVPLVVDTTAYLQQKLDQARTASHLTGREVQVWLIDGTVLGRAALLLGVLLLVGLVYEVLPTARTGRTLGKRLAGVRVVTGAETGRGGRPPGFGRALVRWLVGQLTVLTVLGPLAPLADRQRRRGWADRAARTRVVKA
ncbi:RDD family protein [Kitasatospora sp. NBC_01266]|uniref:RDD family protein n=1 Tax=Kitasatospora sp. NBC_01266 TaxID=2903572 RepID=UPI002E32A563|nr:RDD family protein [Kitasatospora sp. NBC_01266]